jgi:hypothetical protein
MGRVLKKDSIKNQHGQKKLTERKLDPKYTTVSNLLYICVDSNKNSTNFPRALVA